MSLFHSVRVAAMAPAAIAILSSVLPASAEAIPESTDPIVVSVNDWTSSIIINTLASKILTSMGYNVKLVQADYTAQFTGIRNGDIHLNFEISPTVGLDIRDAAIQSGEAVDLGPDGLDVVEEWWYPSYMKEFCPDLPDWKALLDPDCAKAFSTPETAPRGRFLSGPVSWGGFDAERNEALGVPFDVVHAGSDGALFAELASAIDRKAPIMLWLWTPHWPPAKYDGEFVQWPEYDSRCTQDPAWGPNPEMLHDCARPSGVSTKLGWAGGQEKWPAAYAMGRKFEVNNEIVSEMIVEVDLEKRDVDDVLDEWMSENEAIWKSWIQ